MGPASSSAALASDSSAFGSLASMGGGAPKKKKMPVLVLDPEELEAAHALFQKGAAEQLGDFDPQERPSTSATLFGLAPMSEDDGEDDGGDDIDSSAEDSVEEADAPEPDKVLSLTRAVEQAARENLPRKKQALSDVPLSDTPVTPIRPELEVARVAEPEQPAPETDGDYSHVQPGFSTRDPAPPAPFGEAPKPATPVAHDDWDDDLGAADWHGLEEKAQVPETAEEPATSENMQEEVLLPELAEQPPVEADEAEDAEALELGAYVEASDEEVEPASTLDAEPALAADAGEEVVDAEPLELAEEIEEPVAELAAPPQAEPDIFEPEAEFDLIAEEIEAPQHVEPEPEPYDPAIENIILFEDEQSQPEPVAVSAPRDPIIPPPSPRSALRARLVREDVSLARPELTGWAKFTASVKGWWRKVFG